jgi:hypothetical protein
MALTNRTSRTLRRTSASPQVARLIDQIRKLVAEQRRLESAGLSLSRHGRDRLEAVRLEILRLKAQLANVVKRDLDRTSPLLST